MATNIDLNSTSYITQRIASNLNIQDLTPQSKLGVLVNGLENESSIFSNYKNNSLRNFYLQTADAEYLEYSGVAEGITRFKEPLIRVSEDDAIISLTKKQGSLGTVTLERGTTLSLISGESWIVLTSTTTVDGNDTVYLSCDIRTNTFSSNLRFNEGSSYEVNIEGNVYALTFEAPVAVPVLEEPLDSYRERLIYAKNSPRTGCESAVRYVLSSSQIVTDFSVDFSVAPYKLQLFSYKLFEDDTEVETLRQYEIPFLETQLKLIQSEGSSFELVLPKKVNFSVKLRPLVSNPQSIPYEYYSFKEYIQSKYLVGTSLTVDRFLLLKHLEQQGIDTDFLVDYEFVIYKNFLGNSYESSSKTLPINSDEYPYVEEVGVE